MIQAAVVGALAQSSLVLSGLAVFLVRVPRRVVGGLAGYGAGALLGAIAFDSLMPFEFERGGSLAGIATVVGFAVSLASAM